MNDVVGVMPPHSLTLDAHTCGKWAEDTSSAIQINLISFLTLVF
jgi:hypothetical protein